MVVYNKIEINDFASKYKWKTIRTMRFCSAKNKNYVKKLVLLSNKLKEWERYLDPLGSSDGIILYNS